MEFDRLDMVDGLYPYLSKLAGPETGVMAEMEEYGRRRRFPIVGPILGRFLQQLAVVSGARRVLEIGSGYGYSAAWFLRAHPELHVICTDSSELNRERALEFLVRLGSADRVDFRVGDALQSAESAAGPFDIVFCDMDKSRYPDAFERTLPKLRSGGLFIADNVLWRGYAFADLPDNAPEFRKVMTPGIREFNRIAHQLPGVLTSIIPLRDGLSLSVKL
ncbi:O-methyltransferase [Bradyrhizobium diazoefficiens]|uniref:O-methyltransferase n=1 Tax=Bradyrhizobium diazoefficiens TaxID=1355477 RepID=UPI001B8B9161|nr:O-methyltransferase [Bradyrhizobium diazoefficiens]MBR0865900.1 O-methyltransferase [Bradyrhizobium diazoefficiens]MBR0890430.1 O-methyltransferase [Bradyrhizobium diazoefficiens]MBR0922200.1 O-methyltransferase [Bradyrhizobium diazoefficiens]